MDNLIFEVTFNTHGVRVRRTDDGKVSCWKYTSTRVDYEVFDNEELSLNYIVTPFPSLGWSLELNEV